MKGLSGTTRAFIFSILVVVITSTISYANELTYLSFFSVKKVCGDCNRSEFELGSSIFPDYKMHWLPEGFLIKTSPELKFSSTDISNIKIEQIFIFENPNNYLISIELIQSASKIFESYTNGKVSTQAAIKINNKILNIVTIQTTLSGEEFIFAVRGFEYKDILDTLESLSVNITLIGSNSST